MRTGRGDGGSGNRDEDTAEQQRRGSTTEAGMGGGQADAGGRDRNGAGRVGGQGARARRTGGEGGGEMNAGHSAQQHGTQHTQQERTTPAGPAAAPRPTYEARSCAQRVPTEAAGARGSGARRRAAAAAAATTARRRCPTRRAGVEGNSENE